jgi:hypothetical protein
MPKKIMTKKPGMDTEKAVEIFKAKFGDKYKVYLNKLKAGVIKKSPAVGIVFAVKQKEGKTILNYNPFAPNAAVRFLTLGIIPMIILYMTGWKKLQEEVKAFVDTAPEFQ